MKYISFEDVEVDDYIMGYHKSGIIMIGRVVKETDPSSIGLGQHLVYLLSRDTNRFEVYTESGYDEILWGESIYLLDHDEVLKYYLVNII